MHPPAHAPLQLLVVTQGGTIPNWLFQCLKSLERSGAAHILMLLQQERHRTASSPERGSPVRRLLYRLYRAADRRVFRRAPDALAPVAWSRVCPATPLRSLTDPALREIPIDVALDPFSLLPAGCLARRARHGVWRIVFGESGDARTQATPAFWEVVEGRPTTETRLCVDLDGGDGPRALYLSVAATDRRSPSRGLNQVYWRLGSALAGVIQALWQDGEALRGRLLRTKPFELVPGRRPAPGSLETVRACSVLARRYLRDKWANLRYREQWALAYQRGTVDPLQLDHCHMLVPPKDRWWADPFPVQAGPDCYIFHEEMPVETGKGVIVATVLDQDGRAASPIPVLEREYHLSYPFVFHWDGELFMVPETGSSRRVELYRCLGFPSRWRLERVLLAGVTARDPTLAFISGRWWLFANVPPDGVGPLDDLHLFHADTPLGPWTPHRGNPVKSDVRSTRPAGRIFQRQGAFYRPAQDGSRRYGYAVSVNRILRLDSDTYEEREVERITPSGDSRVVGIHTLNRTDGLTVIDCFLRSKR